MRRIALAATVSLATMTVAAIAWKFRGAAVLFLLSLAAAAAVRPPIERLERRLGRGLALGVVYVSGVAFAAMFIYVLSHDLLHELDSAVERLGIGYDRLRNGGGGPVHRFLLSRLPPAEALYQAIGGARPTLLLDQALGATRNAVDLGAELFVVIALSAYWSASREAFERLWLSLLPAPGRARARDIWRAVDSAVGLHLRSEVMQSVLCVLILAVMFRLARLPTPVLPALGAGLFRLVPFFGVPLAGAVAGLAGLGIDGPTAALAAAFAALTVVTLDQTVGRRLFAGRRPSPTLTVLLVVALVDAYGAVGLLLASTLAMAIQIYAERVIATHPRRARRSGSLVQVEERLERVRRRLTLLPEAEARQLDSVVARLGTLTAEARRVAP
jgi:predicted PurR-regulated permease PerM